MAADRVRIALIGAGRMGQVHLAALQSSEQIELTAVVEPFAPPRDRLHSAGLTVHESLDQLLAGDPPDGVLIAVPSERHPELVAELSAAGIPMLCEKPLGVTVADAKRAAAAAAAAGVVLQIGYWRRFVPELRALRNRIQAGELGDICQLSCMQWDAEPPSEQFRASSGGITVDMGVHEFDQTRWLLGQEFSWMAAAAAGPSRTNRPSTDPDSAVVLAAMSGAAAATISLGRSFPHEDSCWLEIWGTAGYERIPFMWDTAGADVFLSSMRLQAEAFARVIRGGDCEGARGADAIAAQAAAALASAALRHGSIALPAASSVQL